MGTNEKLGVNIHVDQLMDTIASNLLNLERLELRYNPKLFIVHTSAYVSYTLFSILLL